jgi:hypothetical protein
MGMFPKGPEFRTFRCGNPIDLSQGAGLNAVVAGAVEQVFHFCLIRLALGFHLLQLILRGRNKLAMHRGRVAYVLAAEKCLEFCDFGVEPIDLCPKRL